jgi:hypothetical protein
VPDFLRHTGRNQQHQTGNETGKASARHRNYHRCLFLGETYWRGSLLLSNKDDSNANKEHEDSTRDTDLILVVIVEATARADGEQ